MARLFWRGAALLPGLILSEYQTSPRVGPRQVPRALARKGFNKHTPGIDRPIVEGGWIRTDIEGWTDDLEPGDQPNLERGWVAELSGKGGGQNIAFFMLRDYPPRYIGWSLIKPGTMKAKTDRQRGIPGDIEKLAASWE